MRPWVAIATSRLECARPRVTTGITRREALTNWWHRYHLDDWQPPELEHDAEWALEMLIKHNLGIGRTYLGDMWYVSTVDDRTTNESLVVAVEEWIDKFASPEPEWVEILTRVLANAASHIPHELLDRIRAAIVRARERKD